MTSKRKHRKLKADINVVPYIDVMLVLLIIFMVTAPMLNLSVQVNLPEANARPVEQQAEPTTLQVLPGGTFVLKVGEAEPVEMDAATLEAAMRVAIAEHPDLVVLVAGEGGSPYQVVYEGITLLQRAGVTKVGLLGRSPAPTPSTAR